MLRCCARGGGTGRAAHGLEVVREGAGRATLWLLGGRGDKVARTGPPLDSDAGALADAWSLDITLASSGASSNAEAGVRWGSPMRPHLLSVHVTRPTAGHTVMHVQSCSGDARLLQRGPRPSSLHGTSLMCARCCSAWHACSVCRCAGAAFLLRCSCCAARPGSGPSQWRGTKRVRVEPGGAPAAAQRPGPAAAAVQPASAPALQLIPPAAEDPRVAALAQRVAELVSGLNTQPALHLWLQLHRQRIDCSGDMARGLADEPASYQAAPCITEAV